MCPYRVCPRGVCPRGVCPHDTPPAFCFPFPPAFCLFITFSIEKMQGLMLSVVCVVSFLWFVDALYPSRSR